MKKMPKFTSEERAKEFIELQNEYRNIARDCANCQRDVRMKANEMQVHQLTTKEIKSVSQDLSIFKSVGKMFLRSTKEDLVAELHAKSSETAKEKILFEKKLTEIQGKQSLLENKLRTLVEQFGTA